MVLWNKISLLHLAEDTIVYDVRKATGLQWSPHIHTLLCCKQIWNCCLWLYTLKDGRLSSACQKLQNIRTTRSDHPALFFAFCAGLKWYWAAVLPRFSSRWCAFILCLQGAVEKWSWEHRHLCAAKPLQCKFFPPNKLLITDNFFAWSCSIGSSEWLTHNTKRKVYRSWKLKTFA